jgi:Zn finger protein HypA/HybF involved in hydrogenase expression
MCIIVNLGGLAGELPYLKCDACKEVFVIDKHLKIKFCPFCGDQVEKIEPPHLILHR